MRAFGKGIWGEVIDRRVEILVAVVGISIIAIQSGFSLRKLVAGKWEAGAVVIGAICALVIWHSFRSAYIVSKELKDEPITAVSPIDSPYGGKIAVDVSRAHSFPRLKLYGIAVCLSALAFATTYFASTKAKEIQQSDPVYLHYMPKQQLVEITKRLTDEMVDFETERDKKAFALSVSFMDRLARATSSEEKDKLSQEMQRESVAAFEDKDSEFRKNYLNRALAVRDELLFRLRKTPEQSEKDVLSGLPPMTQMMHGSIPISRALGGILAGPHPISDAAMYLEGLARLLQ